MHVSIDGGIYPLQFFCNEIEYCFWGGNNNKGIVRMDLFKDLWGFLMTRKKFWLLPIIIVLLLFGILLFLAGGSALAPFIYTIF